MPITNRFDALPDDIKSLIYSFDSTRYELMQPVIDEMKHDYHVVYLIEKKLDQLLLRFNYGHPTLKGWERGIRAMARYRTRRQLLTACRVLECERPRRRMIKEHLVLWIFFDRFYGAEIRDDWMGS
eukprot:54451-Eustigmatos_ZCMA.PRE.1